MSLLFQIAELAASHDRSNFTCGSPALDDYLRQFATQDLRRRIARCYVATPRGDLAVAGYYTISASAIDLRDVPENTLKRLPKYGLVPCVLLGRLAVGVPYQGRKLGAALIADAIQRVQRLEAGATALIVDAKDEAAMRFYEHLGFTPGAKRDKRLILPLKPFKFP